MSKNSSLPSREQQETSELNGSGGGRGKGIRGPRPFIPVGDTNRDKRGSFCPGWWIQPGQKAPVPPAGPASRWTRDKSHLLSRAQRLPGQMAWNKGLFCSSGRRRPSGARGASPPTPSSATTTTTTCRSRATSAGPAAGTGPWAAPSATSPSAAAAAGPSAPRQQTRRTRAPTAAAPR